MARHATQQRLILVDIGSSDAERNSLIYRIFPKSFIVQVDIGGVRHGIRANVVELPIRNESVDMVISRVAMPYMNNVRAFSEIHRILRPDGTAIIQTHAVWHYVKMFCTGIVRKPRNSAYAAAVVLNTVSLRLFNWYPTSFSHIYHSKALIRQLTAKGFTLKHFQHRPFSPTILFELTKVDRRRLSMP